MEGFRPANPSLFFSRQDPQDARLGELAKPVLAAHTPQSLQEQLSQATGKDVWVLAGYPDEEGIRINGGRQGARHAPDTIRRYFYKMTPAAAQDSAPSFYDIGNLSLEPNLSERHEQAKQFAMQTFEAGHRWLAFGGGHDYGYADCAAYVLYCRKHNIRPLVLNFDAHLDVRPTDRGLSSGTPFYRLLDEFSDEIDFAEIGVQSQCNSRAHLKWAQQKGARILTLDEVLTSDKNFVQLAETFLKPWLQKRSAFLSIDIDGFQSSSAPGCSQSWATGLEPNRFCALLARLQKTLDIRGAGIYEVSPPLDADDQTSKLAALIAHRLLFKL